MTHISSLPCRIAGCVAVAAILVSAAPKSYGSQSVEDVMSGIRSPEDIARLFSSEFTYTMTLPDRAHPPEYIIQTRSGDCDDFAILASSMLNRIGVENRVFIIKFKGLKIEHAICAWKGKDGYYNFISNRELRRTGQRTVESAIAKFYPDYETAVSVDPEKYIKDDSIGESASAKSYHGSGLMTNLDPRISADL